MYIFPAEERMNPVTGVKLEFWKECRQPGHERSIVGATVYHVLPDDHSQAVAVPVPAFGFDLHMLAYHVESQLLGFYDVVHERLVGRGCVEPVGPPALIERSELETLPVVELQAQKSLLAADGGVLAHRGVAADPVDRLSAAEERRFEVVEYGCVGGPELHVGERQPQRRLCARCRGA